MIWGNRRATARAAGSILALGWVWGALVSASPAVTLSSVRHSSSKDRTRVVIDLSAKADYSHRILSDPPRVEDLDRLEFECGHENREGSTNERLCFAHGLTVYRV